MMSAAFPGHPGAMQHPGMQHGQPMPGQMGHPGQQMGHPMMQPGVSGPGPHVSQAGPMMGMQPGMGGPGGPNAQNHAMQHLAPGGQMVPQHGMMNNPLMMQQFQQQQQQQQHLAMQQAQARARQQQQQQLMQQQGMQMGLPNGITPQQMAALQQSGQFGGQINLPPHLQQAQQQIAMNQMRQQAQAQAQAHAQQQAQAQAQAQAAAAQHAHQQQQAAQAHAQQQALAQQHHIQMQHANSQASNQGHATPQPGPQAVPNMVPNRPPTAMGNPHTAQPSPAPQPAQMSQPPQQAGPPAAQASQPASSAPQTAPTQAPSGPQAPGPQAQQANKAPQQNQQQPPQAAQQPPQNAQTQAIVNAAQAQMNMKAQAAQQAQAQAAQVQAQAQAQASAQAQAQNQQGQPNAVLQARLMAQRQQQQQAQTLVATNVLLKLFNFCEKLGSFRADSQGNTIEHWKSFVQQHFTEEGSFRMVLRNSNIEDKSRGKQFDVGASTLARYFWTQFESQVEHLHLVLEGVSERAIQADLHSVDAQSARMIYWFKDGTQIVWTGRLQALYKEERMETLHFDSQDSQHYLPRSKIEELLAMASPDQNRSPRLTKKQNPRAAQKQQPSIKLPGLPVTEWGVAPKVQTFLELGETFAFLKDIMYHQQDNPNLTLPQSMTGLIQTYKQKDLANQRMQQAQQGGVPGQMVPPQGGPVNPAMQQMQQQGGTRTPGNFASPAMQHQMLPGAQQQMNGSPHIGPAGNPMMNNIAGSNTHTPSPAMSHMAPPMVPTASQQGNGANSSPQTGNGNKRRRSTAVGLKEEGDDGVNGVKVKPSPRMASGSVKRMKNG